MILTGETEVLGEKHYTAWVVGGWMKIGRASCRERVYRCGWGGGGGGGGRPVLSVRRLRSLHRLTSVLKCVV
jgi:hypothetical protein